MVRDKKLSAVKALAVQMGLRKEAIADLEGLPLDDVAIETTSMGNVNVIGAETAVKNLKASRPHWFGQKAASVNSGTPEEVGSRQVTIKDVMAAEAKAKETGDYAPYQNTLRQYQNQKH